MGSTVRLKPGLRPLCSVPSQGKWCNGAGWSAHDCRQLICTLCLFRPSPLRPSKFSSSPPHLINHPCCPRLCSSAHCPSLLFFLSTLPPPSTHHQKPHPPRSPFLAAWITGGSVGPVTTLYLALKYLPDELACNFLQTWLPTLVSWLFL